MPESDNDTNDKWTPEKHFQMVGPLLKRAYDSLHSYPRNAELYIRIAEVHARNAGNVYTKPVTHASGQMPLFEEEDDPRP